MIKPKTGEYFVSGMGHVCQMINEESYKDFSFPNIIDLAYLIGSPDFSKVRDATSREIQTKCVINQRQGVYKMDTTFNITLENGHKLSGGLKALESAYIEHVFAISKYNQVKTSHNLGISRGCLRMKLREYFGDKYL